MKQGKDEWKGNTEESGEKGVGRAHARVERKQIAGPRPLSQELIDPTVTMLQRPGSVHFKMDGPDLKYNLKINFNII